MRILIILLFVLIGLSCSNQEKKPLDSNYFTQSENDSIFIELQLSQFKSYEELVGKFRSISCSDSISILNISKGSFNKRIKVFTFCKPQIFDPKPRNYVLFENDKLIKNGLEVKYEKLRDVFLKDINNEGKSLDFAVSPEKYLILIGGNESQELEDIEIFLNDITSLYDSIEGKFDLNVMMYIKKIPPTPPTN